MFEDLSDPLMAEVCLYLHVSHVKQVLLTPHKNKVLLYFISCLLNYYAGAFLQGLPPTLPGVDCEALETFNISSWRLHCGQRPAWRGDVFVSYLVNLCC